MSGQGGDDPDRTDAPAGPEEAAARAQLIERLIDLGMDDEAAEIVLLMSRALTGMSISQVASLIAMAVGVVALKTSAAHTAQLLRDLATAVETTPPPGAKP